MMQAGVVHQVFRVRRCAGPFQIGRRCNQLERKSAQYACREARIDAFPRTHHYVESVFNHINQLVSEIQIQRDLRVGYEKSADDRHEQRSDHGQAHSEKSERSLFCRGQFLLGGVNFEKIRRQLSKYRTPSGVKVMLRVLR